VQIRLLFSSCKVLIKSKKTAKFETAWLSFFALGEAMLFVGHDGQQHGVSSSLKYDYSVFLFLLCVVMASIPAMLTKHNVSHIPT